MGSKDKKMWLRVRRLYDKDIYDYNFTDEELPLSAVKEVRFSTTASSEEIKSMLKHTFKIKDETAILKMRNHRGSLIVISKKLSSNSKTVPYILEVTRPHQTVQAKPRSVTRTKHMETLKRTLQGYIYRLDKLDFEVPNLGEKRSEKIKKEMEEVDTKLQFLNKRIGEADTRRWQGMFKKIPLW